jgi:hypothetical protein
VTGGQCLSCAQRASKDSGKRHGGAMTAGREPHEARASGD